MNVLNGSKDLTLVEFLMGLASSGETAEYIQLYLGSSPAGKVAVAAFTTDFLKRKLDEMAPKKGRKGKAASSAAPPISASPAEAPALPPGQATVLASGPTGWAKIPKVLVPSQPV